MDILQDSWFTVKQIAQNTYAISEYGTGIHPFQNFSIQFQLQKRCFRIRKHLLLFIPHLRAVRLPHQNSAEAKKLSEAGLPVKARLVRANNQLIKVSIYIFYLQSLLKPYLLVQMYAFDFYLQQIY
ncbi:hypothetical protein H0I83_08580 [Bacillus thuringiensis serovar fukuokaensis]|uniref:hypothetical protein n=1 Tax=Bacillus TaxID=1386 RepID=UPI00089E663C|nr:MULTISPECIES: hypothetical protein [Bacillus]MBK5496630.1 hypothetical protein [Bacillus sp. TH13]MED1901298.1 hypothetical protein [Bacillus thuringiensis]OTW86006.1 hypothetical protein BK710_14910 [Bacillus thuringiensis serovar sumiyoshiensis]OTX00060.1 hypothetical protein BK711_12000 [Bacillus thuringiensis serovar fukuokaensis]SEG61128.1 hypothetical protein SAMN04487919_114140 [Bacillus sp. ok061]